MKPRTNYSRSVDCEDQVFLAALAPSVDLRGALEVVERKMDHEKLMSLGNTKHSNESLALSGSGLVCCVCSFSRFDGCLISGSFAGS